MVRNGIGADDQGGAVLSVAIDTICPAVSVTNTDQTNGAVLDQVNGAPLLGSKKTLIASGGPFWQRATNFLEVAVSATPVYFAQESGQVLLKRRSNNEVLVAATLEELSSHHDFFVIETAISPNNGTMALVSYGFDGAGTLAAAWYFANVVMPDYANDSRQAIVVEWTDTNNDSVANAADSFVIRSQF